MSLKEVQSRRKSTAALSAALCLLLALAIVPLLGTAASAQVTCSYNVSASVVGGHGSVAPTRQHVERNHSATIHISADTGFHIKEIIDNCHSMPISNPYVIAKVKDRHNVYVTFARDQHKIGRASCRERV